MERCPWGNANEKMGHYHDTVWGVPERDDRMLFRKLILDLNQAGLSWQTIVNKMENFDHAYENFVIESVAAFDEAKIASLLQDAGIIRNRKKIEATVINAQQVLKVQAEFGSFADYLWDFVDFKPIDGKRQTIGDVPTKSELSDRIAKDLKRRGFKFVGSTTIYAFLQAVGIINDHLTTCFRYQEVKKLAN